MTDFPLLLTSLDGELFRLIHERLRNPFFDAVMPILSHPFPYWKVCACAVWLGLILFGRKRWRLTLLFMGIAIGLSDFLSSRVLKEIICRPRPLGGRTYSFPSSHAANFFSAAIFLFLRNKKLWPLFTVGLLVGYSRIYLGSHYPLDVVGGIGLGAVVGLAVFILRRALAHRIPASLHRAFPPEEQSRERRASTSQQT